MPKIIAAEVRTGKFKLEQDQIKQFVLNLFSDADSDISRLISVFDNSEIKSRYISAPIEWYKEEHSFKQRNLLHRDIAIEMCRDSVSKVMNENQIDKEQIDHIIYVNSTGIATPTIDSFLINQFKFNQNIKRTPIWGLGCAGGVVGLSRAFEFVKAYPDQTCLLTAVELCSLTFQKNDFSKSNIIATSLFSDGAASVIIAGENTELYQRRGLKFIDNLSTIYYDSSDVMGWQIVDSGFKVIFSRDIPAIIKNYLRESVDKILITNNTEINDIEYYLAHPGGLKVINALAETLDIDLYKLALTKNILCSYGNMSSVSVLFVLSEFLKSNFKNNKSGLFSALGPGFSSELILFKTE